MKALSDQVRARRAHRRVAAFLGVFLLLHFATHFAALDSMASQAAVMDFGRAAYRIPLLEITLFAAFALQVVLGIGLLRGIYRRKRKDAWHWAQFLSGAYLAYFIVMHSSAALLTRFVARVDTNFYWPAGTLILDPIRLLFAPYYTLAVTALVVHVVAALHFRGPRQWHVPALITGPIAGLAIVLAYSGVLYPVELPPEYRAFFESYAPIR